MKPTQMLRDSWALYRAHWKILTLIIATPSALVILGSLLSITKNPVIVVLGVILSIIGAIFTIVMQPAGLDAIRKLETDPTAIISFKTQYSYGFKLFWSIVFLIFILCLILAGSLILFVIPAIIISLYTGFYLFALVLDNKKGFSALLESYSIVKGRWWSVFGRILFLGLIGFLGSLVLLGIEFILRLTFGFAEDSGPDIVLISILNIVFVAVTGPIFLIYMYKLYNWLKSTRLPDVSNVVFKRWLVTFLVVGIPGVPIFMITMAMIAALTAK